MHLGGVLVPDTDRNHLGIVEVFEAALDVGQADHHLRAIRSPTVWRWGRGRARQPARSRRPQRAILDSLRDTGTAVFASAPLYGGRLVGRVPEFVMRALPEAPGQALSALQFARSTANVTSVVVGMREAAHVEENLRLVGIPRADPRSPATLFAVAARGRDALA